MTTAQDIREEYFEDGVSLSALRSWWSDNRTWTYKTHATLNWGAVHIYDKRTSPRSIAFGYTLALLAVAWTAFMVYGIFFVNPPETIGDWIFIVVSSPISMLPGAFAALVIINKLESWYDRHFTATFCERCAEPTTYPHIFDEHYDVGQHHTYEFCSADCREAWERENVDYDFSGHYDIQEEADEERVREDDFSSAYYVDEADAVADGGGER